MNLFKVNVFPRMRWFVPGWPSWYLSAGHWTQSTGHLNSGAASLKSASGHSPCPAHISASKTPNRTESQLPCSSTTKQCAQTQSITALDDRKVIFGILELCCTQGHISQLGCPNQNVIGLKDDPIWGAMAYLKKKLDAISKQALFTLESIFCGPHFLHSGKNEESVKLEGEILSVAVRGYVGITSWLLTQQLYLSPSAT